MFSLVFMGFHWQSWVFNGKFVFLTELMFFYGDYVKYEKKCAPHLGTCIHNFES